MFIGSERCITTALRRSKRRLQARRDKRLGRIADFLRLMTRAFKCSFSTTGKFEPIPFVRLGGRGAKWRRNGGRPLIQVVMIVKTDEEGSAMSATKAAFVLVPGGWDKQLAGGTVTPIIKNNGFAALTRGLPAAGGNGVDAKHTVVLIFA